MRIILQKNLHPRDYAYEVSALYLVSRCIHTVAAWDLASFIGKGTSFQQLTVFYKEKGLDPHGLRQMIEFLSTYGVFFIQDDFVLPTPLSDVLNKNRQDFLIDEKLWVDSYDIATYLTQNSTLFAELNQAVEVILEENILSYNSEDAKALALELKNAYIVSRILREVSRLEIFDLIENKILSKSNLINEMSNRLKCSVEINREILNVLIRYKFIEHDFNTDRCLLTLHGKVLTTMHPETMQPAMAMIDERWWCSASLLECSFKVNSEPAFKKYNNGVDFYSVYITGQDRSFMQGMAAISLLDNREVAQLLQKSLFDTKYIVDIGGGDAGLLYEIACLLPQKTFHLFEKEGQDDLSRNISERHKGFVPKITLGDFMNSENNIPSINNAAYIIKCCLHNYSEEIAIKVLKNIKKKMGENSKLYIIERYVPNNINERPHINRGGNVLMRFLFGAEPHNSLFYQNVASRAGFFLEIESSIEAENYMIMTAKPKLSLEASKIVSSKICNSPVHAQNVLNENGLKSVEDDSHSLNF